MNLYIFRIVYYFDRVYDNIEVKLHALLTCPYNINGRMGTAFDIVLLKSGWSQVLLSKFIISASVSYI